MHRAHKQTLVGGRIISTFTPLLSTLHVKYRFPPLLQLDVKRWSSVLFLEWLIKVMGSWVGLNHTPPFAVSSHLDGLWKLDPNKNVIIDVWGRLWNWELLGFGSKCLVRFLGYVNLGWVIAWLLWARGSSPRPLSAAIIIHFHHWYNGQKTFRSATLCLAYWRIIFLGLHKDSAS